LRSRGRFGLHLNSSPSLFRNTIEVFFSPCGAANAAVKEIAAARKKILVQA